MWQEYFKKIETKKHEHQLRIYIVIFPGKIKRKGLHNENSYSNISIITGTCETSRTQRKRACDVLILLNHSHIKYYRFANA